MSDARQILNAAGVSAKEDIGTGLVVECFADIEAKPIVWDWPQRIPRGKITLFTGEPDEGKTTVACSLAACYTKRLAWPDGEPNDGEPGDVLMLTAEDDAEDTVKPRLLAAGADVTRVHTLRCIRIAQGAKKIERQLALDADLLKLEIYLKEHPHVRLVIIDPLTNYLGRANANHDQDLRAVLVPIKELAALTDVTFIGLGHFNKRNDARALQRIAGAVAFAGVARAVWLFMPNPEAEGEHLMLLGKGNLTRKRTGMRYRIVEHILTLNRKRIEAPRIEWLGDAATTAQDVFETMNEPGGSKKAKAEKFLRDVLATQDVPSEEIMVQGKARHIGRNKLFDAKKALGFKAYKLGGAWWWSSDKREPDSTEPDEEPV